MKPAVVLHSLLMATALVCAAQVSAQETSPTPLPEEGRDSVAVTLQGSDAKAAPRRNFFSRLIDAFTDIDTTYIERIDYNFTVMGQATTDLEFYTLRNTEDGDRLSFAQRPDFRLGPYFGWQWLFLGYTFDMTQIGNSGLRRGSKVVFSIYTTMLGIDLIWRRTGGDFFLRNVSGFSSLIEELEGLDIEDYISTRVTGINLYYNFNHRRFSSPAVFSQSYLQRRSAGSWQAGLSIIEHDIRFNSSALPEELVDEQLKHGSSRAPERIKFINYSLVGGYAYNWVFHRDWCLGAAIMPSIGYKHLNAKNTILTAPDTESEDELKGFRRYKDNIAIDITGRLGVIYNNGRWFTGLFSVVQNYNSNYHDLSFHNTFGTVNLCGGFYFQRKKK